MFEFHGDATITAPAPFSGDVTLVDQPITSYGAYAFGAFNGILVVNASEKLEWIGGGSGKGAFQLAGASDAVAQKPRISFVSHCRHLH